ncbi:ABC transporter permease [Hyphobacterium sp. CCMP332]|nr:ABC transporter permease [Hyphobacterium sp. CCMP332]
MNAIYISVSNLINKKLNSLLSLILMAFGVALISLLLNVSRQIESQFQKNLSGIDLVVGAKGSPLQIILCTIFHIDYPTGNIKLEDVEWLRKNRLIKNAIPISLGDSYKNFRIVGCSKDYLELYQTEIQKGSLFNSDFEMVLGAGVAKSLGLNIGDHFHSTHGMEENDIMGHEEADLTIVGILKESNTVLDQLILCSNESIRKLHHSSEEDKKEITALLLQFRNPLAAVQLPRQINSKSNLQAASPSFEAARLFSLLNKGIDVLKYIGAGIMVMAGLSIFISLFIALKDRKYELAIIRSFGGSRIYVFSVVFLEAILLSLSGYFLGIVLCHLGLFAYGFFNSDINAYSLEVFYWVKEETYLFLFGLVIATLAAIVPALKAYNTDISETLANAST